MNMKRAAGLFALTLLFVTFGASLSYAEVMTAIKMSNQKDEIYFYNIDRGMVSEMVHQVFGQDNSPDVKADYLGAIVINLSENSVEVNSYLKEEAKIPDGIIKAYKTNYGNEDPESREKQMKSLANYNEGGVYSELSFTNGKLNGTAKICDSPTGYNKNVDCLELPFKDNVADGALKETIDGKIIKEASLSNGLLNGKFIKYDENGMVVCEVNYDAGQLNGEAKEYLYQIEHSYAGDVNKITETITPFTKGVIDGDKTEIVFKAGTTEVETKKVGTFKAGALLAIATYDSDNRLIERTDYDEDGAPKTTTKYDKEGNVIEAIDVKQKNAEIAEEAKKENADLEKVKLKLSKINMFSKYEQVVAILGDPTNVPQMPNGENIVEVSGGGVAAWRYLGYKITIIFRNRLVQQIMLNDQLYRNFDIY